MLKSSNQVYEALSDLYISHSWDRGIPTRRRRDEMLFRSSLIPVLQQAQLALDLGKYFVTQFWNPRQLLWNIEIIDTSTDPTFPSKLLQFSIDWHWGEEYTVKQRNSLEIWKLVLRCQRRHRPRLEVVGPKSPSKLKTSIIDFQSLQHFILGCNDLMSTALLYGRCCVVCLSVRDDVRICKSCYMSVHSRRVYYCSRRCQKRAWPLHRQICAKKR